MSIGQLGIAAKKQFLKGAEIAYEQIITSFANGDKKSLKPLLEKNMFNLILLTDVNFTVTKKLAEVSAAAAPPSSHGKGVGKGSRERSRGNLSGKGPPKGPPGTFAER